MKEGEPSLAREPTPSRLREGLGEGGVPQARLGALPTQILLRPLPHAGGERLECRHSVSCGLDLWPFFLIGIYPIVEELLAGFGLANVPTLNDVTAQVRKHIKHAAVFYTLCNH